MDIFDLQAKISLDVQDYVNGLNGAEEKTKGFGDKLKTGFATAGKVGAAVIGAAGVAAGAFTKSVIDGTREVAAYGDKVDKMSQKMGISAEAYQEWDAILQHSGSSIDSMERGMVTLAKAAESGNDAFEKLGISQEEIAGMNQEELFARTISALQDMESGTERTTLANELLGGSAKELGALLNTSAEETEQMRQRVHELGGIMSDDAVKSAAKYQDSLQDMQTALSGVKRNITTEFLPSVTSVMDGLTELFSGNSDEGIALIKAGLEDFVGKLSETVPKVLEVGGEIVLSLADAILDNADTIIEAGFSLVLKLVDGIVKNLPKIAKSAVEIITTLAKNISKNIKPLLQAFTSAIIEIATELTKPEVLSDLIDAGIELILSLADGLLDAIPQLVAAIPKIITNLVSALSQNSGKILTAGMQLLGSILEAIVKTAVEITKSMPQIIGAIVQGLLDGIASVGRAALNLFLGIEEPADKLSEKLSAKKSEMEDYVKTIQNVSPQIADIGDVLSEQGRSVDELDDMIGTTEASITNILKTALNEQRGLREDELNDIRTHLDDLAALQQEKLETYRSRQITELTALSLEMGDLTKEEAEQRIANAKAAFDASNQISEEAYLNQLAIYQNFLNTRTDYTEEQYNKDIQTAKEQYDANLAENQAYYDKAVDMISTESSRWVQADMSGWEAMKAARDGVLHELETKQKGYIDRGIAYAENWKNGLDKVVTADSVTYLRWIAQTKKSGNQLTDEQKKTVQTMLSVYDDLPEEMDKVGKESLEGLIVGIRDDIPGLQDVSEMSADEIVDTIKRYLQISSPSKVMQSIGENVGQGLIDGIKKKQNSIATLMTSVATSVRDAINGLPSTMYTIGQNIASGIWNGIASQQSRLLNNVGNMMNNIVNTIRDRMDIHSPSRVMARLGEQMAEGIGVGWQSAFSDVRGDISDSLSFSAPDITSSVGGGGVLTIIVGLLESILDNMGYDLVLDTGELVGTMDRELGVAALRKARGN